MRAVLISALALALAPPAHAASGKTLFDANCSRCHGSLGQGLPGSGPSLRNVGAIAADFYVRTGYMPLVDPHDEPSRTRSPFDEPQIRALVGYVASLGNGPTIPSPEWRTAGIASGQKLFATNCAGCHQVVARGGVVTGARVPPLSHATPRQVVEAIRIGPYLMPRFSTTQITPAEANAIVAYVKYTQHPDNPGGWSIGALGPWPEGMITWLLAAVVLVALCCAFGRRVRA